MDPALLAAITSAVTATAAAAGTDAWKAFRTLVDRATVGRQDRPQILAQCETEIVGEEATRVISAVLAGQAESDPVFDADVRTWLKSASSTSDVHNVVSGSAQVSGPVLQGRDFSGTFHFGPAPEPRGSIGPASS
ncbi:hypothetical protein [Nucisporomicrobium flavum]|uniref:hypothetical protein n=1 Tax=Nucisporomicrobium flavum TaxID=2785915 RepID=UPI0018F5F882|nr:hypothetical protein [Nucisporomicrobium flavum]